MATQAYVGSVGSSPRANEFTGTRSLIGFLGDTEEFESGCAYHGITVIVTNLLMKLQHVAVSENSVHSSSELFYGDLGLEFLTLSANVTESAAWIEVTRTWFPLQVYCEHWKCVNRRVPCCRDVIA